VQKTGINLTITGIWNLVMNFGTGSGYPRFLLQITN